jgi:hypothetical protein
LPGSIHRLSSISDQLARQPTWGDADGARGVRPGDVLFDRGVRVQRRPRAGDVRQRPGVAGGTRRRGPPAQPGAGSPTTPSWPSSPGRAPPRVPTPWPRW